MSNKKIDTRVEEFKDYLMHDWIFHPNIDTLNKELNKVLKDQEERIVNDFARWWSKEQTKNEKRHIQLASHSQAMKMAGKFIKHLKG